MPVHDWSRVDANLFHDFHQAWAMAIRNALNAGLLPPGYSALVEQHAAGLVPDVLAVQRRTSRGPMTEPSGGVLTAEPPKTQDRRPRRPRQSSGDSPPTRRGGLHHRGRVSWQ